MATTDLKVPPKRQRTNHVPSKAPNQIDHNLTRDPSTNDPHNNNLKTNLCCQYELLFHKKGMSIKFQLQVQCNINKIITFHGKEHPRSHHGIS